MVEAGTRLEVRAVGTESFERIYPLLALFGNRKMSRDDWRRMLFDYRWWEGDVRGFAIFSGDEAVGFIGTIFSKRRVLGRDQTFCNTSSWIVREDYRNASLLLLKPILGMRDCTIVNATPTRRSYDVFAKLGFRPLEEEQVVAFPIAWPGSLLRGSFAAGSKAVRAQLRNDEGILFEQLVKEPEVCQLVLSRGGRTCYLVATRQHVKRVPVAAIHYVGDPEFLGEHRALAHYALLRSLGAAAILLDRRFARGAFLRNVYRRPTRRLYRPAWPDTPPEAVDGLFSELMTLKI